jgi:hypothetical protein
MEIIQANLDEIMPISIDYYNNKNNVNFDIFKKKLLLLQNATIMKKIHK